MKTVRVTQRDIARKCGISDSLVSRILNGKLEYISLSEETKNHVLRVAEEHGYRSCEAYAYSEDKGTLDE